MSTPTSEVSWLRSDRGFFALSGLLVVFQLLLGLWGSADYFTRGHNGYNSSAYLQSARNTVRWGELFPHQYYTDPAPPPKSAAYTHAPLGLHLSHVAAVQLLGDTPFAVRGVAAWYGALVVLTLLYVVACHWSRAHALLAGAAYIALPINAIYGNMVNHTSGFLIGSLAMLHCYLRYRENAARRWFFGLLLSAYWATFFDWPAYYVAFFIAVHWFISEVRLRIRGQARQSLARFSAFFAGYCAFILLTIALFVATIILATGGLDDLTSTFQARQASDPNQFWRVVQQVPKLMFTYPVLATCAFWLVLWMVQLVRGKAQARDLIPISYGIAGVLHFRIFRSSSVVHEYWLWPSLPFVAICLADVAMRAVALGKRLAARTAKGKWLGPAVSFAAFTPLLYLFAHSAEVTPQGRQVGGSMWFVTTVRADYPEFFDSGRNELRFAEKVKSLTTRSTAIVVHYGMDRFRPEPRFDVTLDRAIRRGLADYPTPVTPGNGIDGTVFIGTLAKYPLGTLRLLARRHPVMIYDHYFFADLRSNQASVRVYELKPRAPRLLYRFFYSPFEPEMEEVRNPQREAELLARVEKRAASNH